MKPITMLKNLLAVAGIAIAVTMTGCREEEDSPAVMSLAVNDTTMNIAYNEGSEHVLVYSRSKWTARFSENVEWADIEKGEGEGNGEFILSFGENEGLLRRAKILISASGVDRTITLTVNQKGKLGNPKLTFLTSEKTYIAWEVSDSLAFEANVAEGEIRAVSTADWVSGLSVKDGQLHFNVAENTTGAERTATVALTYTDIDDDIFRTTATLTQTAESGHLILAENEMSVDAFEAARTAAWDCVLGTYLQSLKLSVEYEGSQTGWISDLSYAESGISFNVAANTVKAERVAVIKAELPEKSISVSLRVTQMSPSKQYSFSELRALLTAAGEYRFDGDWIEGVIEADGGKENMETNPMLSSVAYDANESAITNYVQSTDGSCGMRLKLDAAASNNLKRGDKVKISLNDVTLVREDNPARYTLKGLTANSLTVEENVSVPVRTKTIAQLADEDIYTLTTLKDVEVAFCYGSWVNVRTLWIGLSKDSKVPEPPVQNLDYRILRDASGNSLDMLVNCNTSWLMTDNGVPKGSGNVTGVIVNTESPFHKGMLGRYQIRPMDLSDIEIRDSGFSEILVDWFYPTAVTVDSAKKNVVNSTTGTGTMECDVTKGTQTSSYLNFTGKEESVKSIRYDGVWWKSGAAGNTVKWKFSTKSVAGRKLAFVFAAALGKMSESETDQGPVNWNLDCSTNGTDFVNVAKIRIRPLPAKASKLMSLPAGCDEYCIELPASLAGQDEVTLRLQAADDTTIDFTTGEYTGHVTYKSAQYLRFPAVAVKYVK